MSKWRKKAHLMDQTVRLGAHFLPPGNHVLDGDFWSQFSDRLERVPDEVPAPAPSAPKAFAPLPAPPAPPAPPRPEPTEAPARTEAPSADDAPEGDVDKNKKRGRGK
jgi:hypothetical protein